MLVAFRPEIIVRSQVVAVRQYGQAGRTDIQTRRLRNMVDHDTGRQHGGLRLEMDIAGGHDHGQNVTVGIIVHPVYGNLSGSVERSAAPLMVPAVIDDEVGSPGGIVQERMMPRTFMVFVTSQDDTFVCPGTDRRFRHGIVDRIRRVHGRTAAVGQVILSAAFVHEGTFSEMGRRFDWDLFAEVCPIRVQFKHAQFRACAAPRIQICGPGLGIGKDHGINRLETIAAGQQGCARIGKGAGRPVSDSHADARRGRVLGSHGKVQVPTAVLFRDTGGPQRVAGRTVLFYPGDFIPLQNGPVPFPILQIGGGMGVQDVWLLVSCGV
ncbi:MAG: hypothetical protein BWY09_01565 [Candidatus Hydrogenedentes bacterium ADurb.Bin179]|nr:MAG: hypothetical protein BWY09_01565 [Candidatus Hydrogenedentes bacterium ADurb.Bin179]